MIPVAQRMQRLGDETAFKIGDDIREAEAVGLKVIKLNLGEPDFDSAANINEVACADIKAGNSHYCDPQGILPLRETIAETVSAAHGIPIDPEQVVVTSGGKPPIGFSVLTFVDSGQEVIYPSPGFPIYESWINFLEAVPRPLALEEEKNFRFDLESAAKLVNPNTKLVILNSPSNPTGGVLSRDDLSALWGVLKKQAHPHFRILSDEVYEKILFDGRTHESIMAEPGAAKHTILLNSHSKSFAMTGWRVGYVVLPNVVEARLFRQWNVNTYSCVAPFIQNAARQAMRAEENAMIVADMVREFEARRDLVIEALNRVPGFRCATPAGAFYAFPNVSEACNHLGILNRHREYAAQGLRPLAPATIFQLFALYRHGVATVDRGAFGRIGSEGQHFVRISLASDRESLMEGVRRLAAAATDTAGCDAFCRDFRERFAPSDS